MVLATALAVTAARLCLFLEAIADPKHERHAELLEWCGGDFEPDQFDINEINRRLASLAPRKSTRPKTAKRAAG